MSQLSHTNVTFACSGNELIIDGGESKSLNACDHFKAGFDDETLSVLVEILNTLAVNVAVSVRSLISIVVDLDSALWFAAKDWTCSDCLMS
jgi:hypothetical protein